MADYRFGGEMIGLETRPEYTSYEVTETMAAEADGTGTAGETGADGAGNTDASNGGAEAAPGETAGTTDSGNPQIRIFDGEIQWFDGKYWVSAGNVKEMAKQDPFAAYEENHDTTTSGDTAGSTGSITGSITGNAGGNTTTGNVGQNITGGNTTGTAGGNKNSGTIQKPAALFLLHFSSDRSGRALPVILALWSPDFPHSGPFGLAARLSVILAQLF